MNLGLVNTGGPVNVTVNIYLRSISKIDDVNMEYSAQFTFREEWWDPRLAYSRFADDETEVPSFVVEARRHLIDKPNVLIRIHPNGQILYSVRLSLVLSCPMSLEYYPLDRQTCLIDLASYAYTTDDIIYVWKRDNPVQQKLGLRQSLPSFELQTVLTDSCTSTYSCLRTKLILRREFSYYLLQLYIPSCMLVIVSWVSFWLDKDSVPARVTLGVTTLWMFGLGFVCMAFIFGALLEFALVNYAARKDISSTQQRMIKLHQQQYSSTSPSNNLQQPPQPPQQFQSLLHPIPTLNIRNIQNNNNSRQSIQQQRLGICFRFCCRLFVRRYKERSKRIDVVSRLVFPIGYACFNGCSLLGCLFNVKTSKIRLLVLDTVSFWLDKDAVPARVSLGKLPPVSYIKAVDVWIGACLAFIFAALLEYALVNYYGRREFLNIEKKGRRMGRLSMAYQQECLCPPPPTQLLLSPQNIYHPDFFAPKTLNNNNLTKNNSSDLSKTPLNLENTNFYPKRPRRITRFGLIIKRIKYFFGSNIELSKRVDIVSRVAFPTLYAGFLT
uniref:Glutamate-gated chloride channel n=1 Tax=Meloidogyne floridensis TaxID=298350 RepID=A0A915NRB2_9BILA